MTVYNYTGTSTSFWVDSLPKQYFFGRMTILFFQSISRLIIMHEPVYISLRQCLYAGVCIAAILIYDVT